ncbi:LysR family transcriptional regulator [Pseudomonas sp. S75]|uniref:LysR substrate-binding domain-containing protein n=1 Tax=unclassified Pseudomonas TaxID=196821 RepID=UPI001903D147|nr:MULTISPECIES: LysR substrate-binding domain-containing protein [unclassified Pseudomonas]MBJ9976098.1 LysR family transcriptional regulator [Pseudomonas sp. S30]MBK0153480.1 LysR family transcriptional regulator [Pseudomonas sp. S75]
MTSLRQLRYFVEIADSGSFTAAAQRLYIAQSALSRQIKELEQQLGTALLERTARQPRLTAAGEVFLGRARQVLGDLEKAERLASEVGQGLRGRLRLNHSSTVPLTGVLLERLGGYVRGNPDVTLDIAQQSSEAQLQDIADGRLDLGLLRLPVLRQHPDVTLLTLFDEPLLLAVAAGHELAGASEVSVRALKTQPFVSIPHRDRGGLSYLSASVCLAAGFFPRAAQIVSRKTTQLQLIQAGLGVALLPASMREIAPSTVRFIPLVENCQSSVALASRRDAGILERHLLTAMSG